MSLDEPAADGRGDGIRFREILIDAATLLERRVGLIDALNVFPVPDGDTGTNLVLTMRAAIEAARERESTSVGEIAAALARGALLGAHGNSGVILSQYLRGIARSLDGWCVLDAVAVARALDEGSTAARLAVDQPVEGTILTVAQDAARAASRVARFGASVGDVLLAASDEAKESVARTRGSLPVLREADVVDAGALGLATILEGMALSSRGESLPSEPAETGWRPAALDVATDRYGYCTEFVIRGDGLDPDLIRGKLKTFGDSVLAVGDSATVRVHLHTFTPTQAIDFGSSVGLVDQIKVDDMQDQNRHLRARGCSEGAPTPCALLVAVDGEGFAALFRSLGAEVVRGAAGPTAVADGIHRAIRETGAEQCVLLWNGPMRIPELRGALSARGLTEQCVTIVSAGDPARGVAAALAFQSERCADENARAMERALAGVRTARIAAVDGRVVVGQTDGEFEIVGDCLMDVTVEALNRLGASGCEVITLYPGSGVGDDDLNALLARVRDSFPGQQIDSLRGGPSHDLLCLSCE